jgi:hypothetical protein
MKFFDFSFTFAIAFLLADIGIIYWVYTGEFNLKIIINNLKAQINYPSFTN